MRAHQAQFPVATMCRVLRLSSAGYYAWCKRPASVHAQRDEQLLARIRQIHADSLGTYGTPRIHAQLVEEGYAVSRKRVARLLKQAGLRGICRRQFVRTTMADKTAKRAKDLVNRDFSAKAPNRLWVADITRIATWAGALYLAVVLDVFSRKIVGWAMALSLHTKVVLDALNMAVAQRRPIKVIHHSDQGSQFTSLELGKRCRETGVRPSMGSVGDCYDNAMAESFFATLECELLDRNVFRTREEAEAAVFNFIEGWYNPHRKHSSIDYRSPVQFEKEYYQELRKELRTALTHRGARRRALEAPAAPPCG